MRCLLKNKLILILMLGFFVGLIHVSHHFLMFYSLKKEGKSYQPLTISEKVHNSTVDETFVYAPKVREIYDGSFPLREVAIWEYQKLPTFLISETLPALLLAGLAKISGSVSIAFILSDFIFPMLIFWLCFCFLFFLTRKVIISIAGGILLFFAQVFVYDFPYLPSAILEMVNFQKYNSLLWFTRTFHPQVSFLFLLLAIFLLFYLTSQKKIKNIYLGLTGIAFGLLFYTYFFYWTWFVVGFLMYGLFLFIDKNQRFLIYRFFIVLSIALIIAVPFFQQNLLSILRKIPNGFLERNNIYGLLGFSIVPFLRIIFFSFFVFVSFKNKKNKLHYYLQSFLLSSFILFLTPYFLKLDLDDMVGHWNKFCLNSWLIITTFILLNELVKNARQKIIKIINYFLLGFSFLGILYGFCYHWQFAKKNYLAYEENRSRRELYDWLNMNTKKDEVILTLSFEENLLLPAFTHNNIFIPNFNSSVSTKEIIERFLYAYKLFGVDWKEIEKLFPTEEDFFLINKEKWRFNDCGGWYLFFYQKGSLNRYFCGIEAINLEKLKINYFKLNLSQVSAPYLYNYILVGPYEKKIIPNIFFEQTKTIYKNENYLLFKKL